MFDRLSGYEMWRLNLFVLCHLGYVEPLRSGKEAQPALV